MKRRLNQTKQRNIFLKRKFHPNLRDAYSKSNIFVNQIKTKKSLPPSLRFGGTNVTPSSKKVSKL